MNDLLKRAISLYKKRKRDSYLNQYWSGKKNFAFVGAGSHSIANLYPCIQHLGIPLKIIVSSSGVSAQKMAQRFANCSFSHDLNSIINDSSIDAVFVSTTSSEHFQIAKSLLNHNKHVFIEKPPCYSLNELEELIVLKRDKICFPALQKRNGTINRILKKIIKNPASYHCQYLVGAYPEGDPIFDLFIHPIDNVIQLFGIAVIENISITKDLNGMTCFITLRHQNKVMGILQLSTHCNWLDPKDNLEILTSKEVFMAEYPNRLKSVVRPSLVFGVPMEKVMENKITEHIYFNNNGVVPSAENNSLLVQGFYGEVETFAKLVETGEGEKQDISSLINTYTILEAIKRT